MQQQAEASSLKAELQGLTEAMRKEADKRSSEAAEEKQSLAHHQARLDTLQVLSLADLVNPASNNDNNQKYCSYYPILEILEGPNK